VATVRYLTEQPVSYRSTCERIYYFLHASTALATDNTAGYSTAQLGTAQCSTVQYSAVQYSTIRYSTVQDAHSTHWQYNTV
jgi:hypothetical protein